jgi:hypothetical protein
MALIESSFDTAKGEERASVRRLRLVAWSVTIFAGFLQAWATRFSFNRDGLYYLDIASACLHGDWKSMVNGYWSPFYSWLVALFLGVFRPNPYWESTILHLVNFTGLLVALRCFEFFFRSFLQVHKQISAQDNDDSALPEFGWWTLGYGLFLSTTLFLLPQFFTTPDLWVSVFTYVVAGLVLRIWAAGGGWARFAALGFALALAYLTKAFYFPLSFVFLPTAWLATGNPRKTIGQAALGLVAFALLAGPWIAALSDTKGRVTFGDVGKLNFAMMIDEIPQPWLWQGGNGTGTPRHPVRQLLTRPRVYEFAAPIGGTYPPGFDLSYWMEGVHPYFRLRGFAKVLRQSAGTFFQLWLIQVEYVVALLALLFLTGSKADWIVLLRQQSYLWVPPLVACSAYAIVHVESRLVGPFVLPLWLAAFFCLFGAVRGVPNRFFIALVFAILSVTGIRIAKSAVSDIGAIFSRQENLDWEVARELRNLGMQPGDKVSDLCLFTELYWARLAGVQIVSEIPLGDEDAFWSADAETKRKVFGLLASTGASVIVTNDPPLTATSEGWIPLGTTGFYAYRLRPLPAR